MNIEKLKGDTTLSIQEAFFAMYIFLDFHNKSCSNELEVSSVLSDCSILEDGGTADPAMWDDWLDAVEKARNEQNRDVAKFRLG